MDEFLILLQAKLDEAKSKGNVNANIKELQSQLDKLKVQVELDPKSITNIVKQLESALGQKIKLPNISVDSKIGQQIGNNIGQNIADSISKSSGKVSAEVQKIANQVNKIQLSTDVDTLTTKYQKFGVVSKEVEDNLKDLRLAKEAVLDSKNDENPSVKIEQYNEALKRTKASITELTTQEVSLSKRTAQMDGMRNWMLKNQNAVKLVGAEVDKLIKECETCDSIRFEGIKREFRELQTQAREAGKLGNSLWGSIKEQLSKFSQWFSVSSLFTNVLHGGKQMVNQVKEVNSAMVELTKVSDASASEIKRYFGDAAKSAKALGSSVSDVINATADFSRLGYSLPEASELAKVATLYKNVGDGINIDEASSSLVSTMKAFNITAEDSISIIDKLNEVGNNFSISSGEIGEALKRSASSLSVAGNSLSESIGLITAGNTVVQDADMVGTALKTMSLRITSTSAELTELGEDTEFACETLSDYRDLVMGLTHNKVNILDDNDNYKSTFQILKEISNVWKDMNSMEQSSLMKALFGVRQANIGSSILENFDVAEKAMKSAEEAAGSALKEQEAYEKGVKYSLDRLEAVFQTFANHILNSNFLKGIIDFGSGTIEVIDKVISKLGSLGTIGLGTGLFAGLKNVGSPKMFGFSFV